MLSSRLLLALGAFGSLLSACRSADLASANLDQVMGQDNTFRYSGRIQSGVGYLLRSVIDPSWLDGNSLLAGESDKPIPNPTRTALSNLLALRKGSAGLKGPFLRAERVRQYARYAAFCPSTLCRERALLELVPLAAELDLGEDLSPPSENVANAAELGEGMRGLREVLVQLAGAKEERSETLQDDFRAACALLGNLELDIEGGRRLLRIIAAFGQLEGLRGTDLTPLLALAESVERRMVTLALSRARYDPSGSVRAAALRVGFAAYGDPFLHEALLNLVTPRRRDGNGALVTSPRYHLLPEIGDAPEPYETVFALVRAEGLPTVGESPAEAIASHLAELHALMQVVHDFSTYPDPIRALAMITLGEVSGASISSLREEDWERWWDGYREGERLRLDRARAEEALQAGSGAGESLPAAPVPFD